MIPAEHPSLPGHFPGQPLVPGVVILDQVIQALAEVVPGHRLAGVRSAKFVAPLLPGQRFEITLRVAPGEDSAEFVCQREGQRLALGRVLLQPRQAT